MPKFKEPKSLEILAVSRLGDWIAQHTQAQMASILRLAQKDTSVAHKTLAGIVADTRTFLQNYVPWMLYDALAQEALRALKDLLEEIKQSYGFRLSMGKFVSQMNVIVSMTEAVFTENITILSIDAIPKIMRSIFYSKLHMLTGLVQLNLGSLSGGWKTSDMEGSIIHALTPLRALKYLSINYDCTDGILKCIKENCKNIKKIDVSCSKNINNESVTILSQMESLRSVQLYRTSVTLEGFAQLLINHNQLEDIGRCDDIGKVLEYISIIDPNKTLNLVIYVSRYAPQKYLQLAVEMCPSIRSMTVYHNSLQGDLMALMSLKDLCELKLMSCDFYADQIKQLLQVKGCNIINLHLEHVDQIDLNALMYISQMCPFLQSLTLYNCTLIQHTSLYTRKLEILPFRSLKRISCVSTCTNEQLQFILTNALNVEHIHLGTAVYFTDDLLDKVLNKNGLLHLKELRIVQSDCLGMQSVMRILECCPSLEILLEIECWTKLSETDREYVKNYLKVNNLNVALE